MKWIANMISDWFAEQSKKGIPPIIAMKKPERIGICIGHSRKIKGRRDGGAVSVAGVSEWSYNRDLADLTQRELAAYDIPSVIYDDYEGDGYGASMTWLSRQLASDGCIAAIELHFNSSHSSQANGHEQLHWHSSIKGRQLASEINVAMVEMVPQIRSRGTVPIMGENQRGGSFLRRTQCTAIIQESGFGSSPRDWDLLVTRRSDIAKSIAKGVREYLS